jgi:hypothetical protein
LAGLSHALLITLGILGVPLGVLIGSVTGFIAGTLLIAAAKAFQNLGTDLLYSRIAGTLALPLLSVLGWLGHGPLAGSSHILLTALFIFGAPFGYSVGLFAGALIDPWKKRF